LIIHKLRPKKIEPEEHVKILGANFGSCQESGEVRLGRRKAYNSAPFNKGKILPIKYWSNSLIKVKVPLPAKGKDRMKVIWVIRDGKVSNKKRLKILAVLPSSTRTDPYSHQPYIQLMRKKENIFQWMPSNVLPQYSGLLWHPESIYPGYSQFIDPTQVNLTYFHSLNEFQWPESTFMTNTYFGNTSPFLFQY